MRARSGEQQRDGFTAQLSNSAGELPRRGATAQGSNSAGVPSRSNSVARWFRRAVALSRFCSVALLCSSATLLCLTASDLPAQLVIVSGIGGEPKYTQLFGQLSTTLAQAANERAKLADSSIIWLGDTSATTKKTRWYRGPSTKANIEQTLGRLAGRGGTTPLALVLIGHGSGAGTDTRISLPGPDMTAADFARVLSAFGDRRVAFVNLTSASGDMLEVVASPTRIVMTATKSAFQRNESQFARYFVDAFALDGADIDKDNRVSMLEAFKYAEAETKRFYETDGKLATENAQLADQSSLAARFFLASDAASTSDNPRLNTLYTERTTLDTQIQELKKKKSSMAADAYDAELETLLLSLARKSREIRQLERGS
jgi:hypothetical protein